MRESLRIGTITRTSTPRSAAPVRAISAGEPGTKYGVVIHTRRAAPLIAASIIRWIASCSLSGPEATICTACSPTTVGRSSLSKSSAVRRLRSPVA